MRERQLCWLQLLCNSPSLVGVVHRIVASIGARWREPSQSLSAALKSVGWTVRRNTACLRASRWPLLALESSYPGAVELQPQDTFPMDGAVFTDGSLSTSGGAAAIRPDDDATLVARVPGARSSTHCELVALTLALNFDPSQLLTDSLVSLQLVQHWGSRPLAQVLSCPDRAEVRHFIHAASTRATPPLLEKVKAHDSRLLELGHPKAVGNDAADTAAKRATRPTIPPWTRPPGLFEDAVELLDASGSVVLDVCSRFADAWWAVRRGALTGFKELLYPASTALDWGVSGGVFRRPIVSGGRFVHPVLPAVIKWTARIRCGCLATRERLLRHGLVPSASCPCCAAPVEDDAHVLAGCPAIGTSDWLALLQDCWRAAAEPLPGFPAPFVPWLATHRFPLLAALIPLSLHHELAVEESTSARFAARFHTILATQVAERLRRRQALIAAADRATPLAAPRRQAASGLALRCPLPPERQLSLPDMLNLEANLRGPSLSAQPAAPVVPPSGDPRQRWLRARLVDLIRTDTEPCPLPTGATAVVFLELFERVVQEPFTDTPGRLVTFRVRSIAKVLGNITREVDFTPPLVQTSSGSLVRWNRAPLRGTDVAAWRRRVEAAERHCAAPLRLADQMEQADRGLATWFRQHHHLRPVDPSAGESGMALLLLWEVDHGMPYPTAGSRDDLSALLTGFTRRLQRRVQADHELTGWLQYRDLQQPISPGLPPSHHIRWGVSIIPPAPGAPRAWYDAYNDRWQAYLKAVFKGSHAPVAPLPVAVPPDADMATSSTDSLPSPAPPATHQQRPTSSATAASKRRRSPPCSPPRPRPKQPSAPPPNRRRPRSPSPEDPTAQRPPRRQRDIRGWLTPTSNPPATPSAPAPGHSRAEQGPPT